MSTKHKFVRMAGLLVVAAMLFAALPAGQAQAQTGGQTLNVANWTAAESLAVNGRPTVLKDGDTYHMWYGPTDTSLYHISSSDPTFAGATGSVTTYDTQPVEVASPAIIKEGGTFYMVAYDSVNTAFALYTSTDGTAWTKGETVFDAADMDDLGKIDAPFLFKDGETYRLYFQKKNAAGTSYHIYTAETSVLDGTDFVLANGGYPVLSPGLEGTWDDQYVFHPWVVKDGGSYYMWYSAYGTSQVIGMAKSADGYTWVKSPANPILGPVGEPSVINDGGVWQMWYLASGNKVNYLTATGPFEFQSIQSAIDAAVGGETILVAPGTYNENVVINKPNLTLKSSGTAQETIVSAPTGIGISILKDLGTVTVDGFTVQGWTIAGIVQGFAQADGTQPIVKNNIVQGLLGDENHGNCIQVTGANSIVEYNIVDGAFYTGTGPYGASGILVYMGDNSIVRNNVVTHADIGIAVAGGGPYGSYPSANNVVVNDNEVSLSGIGIEVSFDANNTSIRENFVHDNETGLFEEYNWGYGPTGTIAFHNQLVNNTEQALTESLDGTPILTDHVFKAEENWWGSITGPGATEINEYVDYAPWCGDAECSFFVTGVTPGETPEASGTNLETTLSDAQPGDTIYVPEAAYTVDGGFVLNKPGVTLILGDGVVIQNNSPCFTVTASYMTVTSESVGGAVCKPTEGSPGVVVEPGLTNIVIEGFVIDGSEGNEGTGDNLGILFEGGEDAVTDVIVRDILFRNLFGNAIHFETNPLGYVEIKGNLFMQDGLAVNVGGLDVEFNSWGSMDGPVADDDLPAGYNVTNWTHVDVYVSDGVGSRYLNEIALGDATAETITYNVYANLQNAYGAQFTLTFDPEKLQVTGTDMTGTVFPSAWGDPVSPGVSYDNTTGKITFAGGATSSAVSGMNQFLFSVTFTGLDDTPVPNPLSFAATDEALFGMNPGSGSSLNIYAAGMAGVADVNVYDLPTLAIAPLTNFAVGNPKEFSLTATNPATGRDYTNLELDLSGLDATLEYWDGSAWVTYTQGTNLNTDRPLIAGDSATVDFKVTFNTAGANTATVRVYDDTILLVTDTFEFTVLNAYTVTGTVQMQGRTVRDGVLVELFNTTLTEYTYDTLSTSLITGNFSFMDLAQGNYLITFTQDRYLDLTLVLGKGFDLAANIDLLDRLELRGGDLDNNETVDISDASKVGSGYGAIGDNEGDANFDEKVNIQDLAMVGGNYTLTSASAYADWLSTP